MSDYNNDETIINYPETTEQPELSADEESLQRLWNEFNTADDKYTMYIDRAIPGQAKTVHCFTSQITGEFDDIVNQCRAEYIPPDQQEAEFIFKVKNKSGKWVSGGNKRMIITRKNSEMKSTNDGSATELSRALSMLMQRQAEQNAQMIEKILETRRDEKGNSFFDFLQSPAFIALAPFIGPALANLMKPKEAAQPTSMKEMIETMILLKSMNEPQEKDEPEEQGFASVINNLVKTMGEPIARGAMALQQREQMRLPQAPITVDKNAQQIDQRITQENEHRKKLLENTPPQAEQFLNDLIKLALGGARNDAPPDIYADIILDQIDPIHLPEFATLIADSHCYTVLAVVNPECNNYKQWFAALIQCLQNALQDALSDDSLAQTDQTDFDNESSDDDGAINANTIGGEGNPRNIASDEKGSP